MNEKPKILVVDDNESVSTFIAFVLRRQNYDVITADSGIEALELLEEEAHIDVILLDVLMPGLDGFEVLEHLKTMPKRASVKVIMLSGLSQVQEKVRAFSAGAVDYLPKPFQKDELIARVQTHVRVKRAEEELHGLLAKTQRLYRFSRSLIGAENLPDLLQVVVDGVAEALPANSVTLMTFDLEEQVVTNFVTGGLGIKQIGHFSFGQLLEGLSGWVVKHKKPALLPKGFSDPRESLAVQHHRKESGYGSILVVPLVHRDKTIGTLTALNRLDERDFSEQDIELMLALSNQAIIAIENTTLFQALRESEERTRLIIETSLEAIVTIDAEGIITSWNAQAETIFGWSREDAVGLEFADTLLMPPYRQNYEDGLKRFPATVQQTVLNKRREVTALHRDGRAFPVELTITPFSLGDKFSFSAFIHDITERKRAAEALHRAKEAAEAAAQAKTKFLANMSHEIRTPLNAIIGMSGLLLDTPLIEEQHEFVQIIRGSGDALLTIINDILDFSKIEAGRLELERNSFNLCSCVEEALDLLTAKTLEKGLEMLYFIDPKIPLVLLGDVTRLRQILVNLLSNAVKFTKEGEVVVEVDGRLVDHDRYQLHFSVRDTGIGIPLERMNRLFQSFSQVDASTTRKYGGTGLGLVISKRLAEMMGGTISVQSTLGVGSTFYLTIMVETLPYQNKKILHKILIGKRILIVDDNQTNLRILTSQTDFWGMVPVGVSSGSEALSLLQQGHIFDIALLDMQMPKMDGLMLAKNIQKLDTKVVKQFPLVMLTSLGWRKKIKKNMIFHAYLTKPVKSAQLYDVLVNLVSHHEGLSSGTFSSTLLGNQSLNSSSLFDSQLATRHPLRILLAEDNAVNQRVALRLLERLGYRADVAANGLEVLAALQQVPYDVVLMDVQMPEMDGVEATRQIQQGNITDTCQQPRIIAMTAHALQGDRARYLAEGMDDYISKPVRVEELIAALERCPSPLSRTASTETDELLNQCTSKESEAESIMEPIRQAIRSMIDDDDPEMLRELVDLFLQDTVLQISALREALDDEEQGELKRVAHTLKGSSSSLGLNSLTTLCKQLEEILRQQSFEMKEIVKKVTEIENEYARIENALSILGITVAE